MGVVNRVGSKCSSLWKLLTDWRASGLGPMSSSCRSCVGSGESNNKNKRGRAMYLVMAQACVDCHCVGVVWLHASHVGVVCMLYC